VATTGLIMTDLHALIEIGRVKIDHLMIEKSGRKSGLQLSKPFFLLGKSG